MPVLWIAVFNESVFVPTTHHSSHVHPATHSAAFVMHHHSSSHHPVCAFMTHWGINPQKCYTLVVINQSCVYIRSGLSYWCFLLLFPEEGYVKMYLKGRPITMFLPKDQVDSYCLEARADPPGNKLKLDWVYPFAAHFLLLWRELAAIRIIADVFRCWFSRRSCSCPGLSCSCPAGTQLVSGSSIGFVLSVFHLLVEECGRL